MSRSFLLKDSFMRPPFISKATAIQGARRVSKDIGRMLEIKFEVAGALANRRELLAQAVQLYPM
jgi:hypothetical protein